VKLQAFKVPLHSGGQDITSLQITALLHVFQTHQICFVTSSYNGNLRVCVCMCVRMCIALNSHSRLITEHWPLGRMRHQCSYHQMVFSHPAIWLPFDSHLAGSQNCTTDYLSRTPHVSEEGGRNGTLTWWLYKLGLTNMVGLWILDTSRILCIAGNIYIFVQIRNVLWIFCFAQSKVYHCCVLL